MAFRVRNWTKFQHYKERRPPWIKLHRDLLDDFAFASLPLASKALAPCIWLLASESVDGSFTDSIPELAFRFRMKDSEVKTGLSPLITAGFIESEQDASTALASREHDATPEREEEREGEERQSTELEVEVFDYWRKVCDHPKALLTPQRKRLIEQRLKEGYDADRLKAAVDGCRLDPFSQGENDRHIKFDDIALICRDGEHVEKFERVSREGLTRGAVRDTLADHNNAVLRQAIDSGLVQVGVKSLGAAK